MIESAILVEEMYRVEPSASLTIFSTRLGLLPMNLTGKPEHKEFLEPFLSGQNEPVASLVFSEPEGVANYLEKGAPGLGTVATSDGDEWVINGEKVGESFINDIYLLSPFLLLQKQRQTKREARRHDFFALPDRLPSLVSQLIIQDSDLGHQQRRLGLPGC